MVVKKRYHNMVVGTNSRLDELQAGLLRVKLSHLDELNNECEKIALNYLKGIKNQYVKLPKVKENCTSIWHLFVVETDYRGKLMEYLNKNNIETIIHYPIPPHLSEAYEYLGYKEGDFPIAEHNAIKVLTLPLYNGMTEEEQNDVINVINLRYSYGKETQ